MIYRDRNRPRWKVAAVVAALAAAGIVGWASFAPSPPAVKSALNPAPSAPKVLAYPHESASPAAPIEHREPAKVAGAPPPLTGEALFERLHKSPSYADHQRAYAMAEVCLREARTKVRDIGAPCELPPGGAWINAEVRRELVTECAVKGDCWFELTTEGPSWDDGAWRNSPQEFHELEQKAYQAALKTADPFALAAEATSLRLLAEEQAQQGKQIDSKATFSRALAYEVASTIGLAKLSGMGLDPDDIAYKRSLFASLSREEQDRAVAEGRKLAEAYLKKAAS